MMEQKPVRVFERLRESWNWVDTAWISISNFGFWRRTVSTSATRKNRVKFCSTEWKAAGRYVRSGCLNDSGKLESAAFYFHGRVELPNKQYLIFGTRCNVSEMFLHAVCFWNVPNSIERWFTRHLPRWWNRYFLFTSRQNCIEWALLRNEWAEMLPNLRQG